MPVEAARHIAQLATATGFTKILMMLAAGQVETLAG
jgi:hypothetical protein